MLDGLLLFWSVILVEEVWPFRLEWVVSTIRVLVIASMVRNWSSFSSFLGFQGPDVVHDMALSDEGLDA